MIRRVLLVSSLLFTTACAGGTYNKEADGSVAATGWAAVTAAGANTSHREECVGGCRNVQVVQTHNGYASRWPHSNTYPHGHTTDGRCSYPSTYHGEQYHTPSYRSSNKSTWEQDHEQLKRNAQRQFFNEMSNDINRKIREVFN